MAESTTLRLLMAASPEDYSLASAYTSTCDCLLKILAGHLATKNFSDTLNQIAKLILSMISLLESSCLVCNTFYFEQTPTYKTLSQTVRFFVLTAPSRYGVNLFHTNLRTKFVIIRATQYPIDHICLLRDYS